MRSWYSLPVTACGAAGAVSVVMGRFLLRTCVPRLRHYIAFSRCLHNGKRRFKGLSFLWGLIPPQSCLAGRPHGEHLLAPRLFLLRLLNDVRRDVELHHAARPHALLAKTCRKIIVRFGEAGAVIECPFVLEAPPADLSHVLGLHRLA